MNGTLGYGPYSFTALETRVEQSGTWDRAWQIC
jgi:hypothetical protein